MYKQDLDTCIWYTTESRYHKYFTQMSLLTHTSKNNLNIYGQARYLIMTFKFIHDI